MVADLKNPNTDKFACPTCGRLNFSKELMFQGIHILANCTCTNCSTDYFHTLSLAHTREIPIAFSHDGKSTEYNAAIGSWLARPLIKSLVSNRKACGEIEQEVLSPGKRDAILINCLDDCFGHVFTKLCNVSVCRKKNPEAHIIAILPEKLRWLIPEQLDEAWLVKGLLSDMNAWIDRLDSFVYEQVQSYSSFSIYPSSVFADASEVDFYDYLHVLPFDYSKIASLPKQVTYILREDRFWHSGRTEEFFFKLLVKLNLLNYFKGYFCLKQNNRIVKTTKKLQKVYPAIRVFVAGLGTYGKFPDFIHDKRHDRTSPEDERAWLDLYSKSHVIAGIHGSNMILPGIQAATMIELVPDYKQRHIGETTLKDYPSKNMCEHVLGFCSPAKLAGIIGKKLTFLENTRLI